MKHKLHFLTWLVDVCQSWWFSWSPARWENLELGLLGFWLQLRGSKYFQKEMTALLGAALTPWSIRELPKVRRVVLDLYPGFLPLLYSSSE